MLYVDAATFLCSFALLLLFVPARPPLPQTEDGRGVLAGIRFLLRDPLLRVLGRTALVANGLGQMLGAGLTVLAYEEYDELQGGRRLLRRVRCAAPCSGASPRFASSAGTTRCGWARRPSSP